MRYVGIDPGNEMSAVVITNEYHPLTSDYLPNNQLRKLLVNERITGNFPATLIIEKPVIYNKFREISDTLIWIGIFIGSWPEWKTPELITRQAVKMNSPHGKKTTDRSIRNDLRERFGEIYKESLYDFDFKENNKPKLDIWQAYAVIVTYLDKIRGFKWQLSEKK